MNEQLIQKQYIQIVSLLEEKRLKEALFILEEYLEYSNDWSLRTQLEQVTTSYQYMLQYMRVGMKDPERSKLYLQLIAEAWEIADQVQLKMLDEVSYHYYHSLRKNPQQLPQRGTLADLQKVLEAFPDELAVLQLIPDTQQMNAVLKRHETAHQTLFLMAWINSCWSTEEEEQAQNMLQSELLPVNDLCLFVSGITLSLMKSFDNAKVNWLLDAFQHTHPQVNQRALVGLALILHLYPQRVYLYPELVARLSLLAEDADFASSLNRVYIQLLRSQETEKINKKMQEEIIPEMLKSANKMRNFNIDLDDLEENDRNPDWEKAFEEMGLSDKIREMSELQLEGADVYMSTFAQLKGYSFFREPHNWFYPFDPQHSSVIQQLGVTSKEENSILSIILQSGFFCNSDKYSFCLTIANLPKTQYDMMLSQMVPQDQQELMQDKNPNALKQGASRPEVISNQYIHDLYRFFKLNQRRHEFKNVFQEELALHRTPILKEALSAPELLKAVADFLFQKEHVVEALELYQLLIARKQANAEIFQKAGYCLQKAKRHREAVNSYLKADVLKPDHIWTLRHLATCYRQLKEYGDALDYYKRVEAIQPENRNLLFYIGSCMAEQELYEEALQYFFKLDFLEENSIKAWRGIGWCSFVSGKHEQAMKYYEKILAVKPVAIDYLNSGHVAWRLGLMEKAIQLYGQAVSASDSRESFLELFNKDRKILLQQGIAKEEIPLMLDLI